MEVTSAIPLLSRSPLLQASLSAMWNVEDITLQVSRPKEKYSCGDVAISVSSVSRALLLLKMLWDLHVCSPLN